MAGSARAVFVRRLRRAPCISLAAGACAAILFLFPAAAGWLEFQRTAVLRGELWRLLTCHMTHFTAGVLLWDVAALVCLGAVCEIRNRKSFVISLGAAAILIPAAVLFFQPGLSSYRGLSGIASALFGLLAVFLLREGARERDGWRVALAAIFFLLFLGKVAFETASGLPVFASDYGGSVEPVPLAHAVGLCVGIVTALAAAPEVARTPSLGPEASPAS